MKTYNVKCLWTLMGSMDIEANSEAEAREKARTLPNPTNGEYLEDSFEIDSVEEVE